MLKFKHAFHFCLPLPWPYKLSYTFLQIWLGRLDRNKSKVFTNLFISCNALEKIWPELVPWKLSSKPKTSHLIMDFKAIIIVVKSNPSFFTNAINFFFFHPYWSSNYVATPLLEECEDDIHIFQMGTWESSRTPKTSELDCRGQNISPWGVLHIIGKLSKCRCRKWPCMSHLDIYNTSYGKKKGQELIWPWCVQVECDTPLESS